ncbi:MAG: nuclear transport factor 2 family protein [Candidatus Eremiobacteraeota bacterium]|nr:nuclear transport factor 2 family protein [Candidatus Eremiobacteraeota bacterium]
MAVAPERAFGDSLRDHLDAIAERDLVRFAKTVHRDVALVGPAGSVLRGYDAAIAAHRDWFSEDGWTFSPEILWTNQRDDCGWALTSVTYSTLSGALSRFLLFLLFVRGETGWQLIYDQNTPLSSP